MIRTVVWVRPFYTFLWHLFHCHSLPLETGPLDQFIKRELWKEKQQQSNSIIECMLSFYLTLWEITENPGATSDCSHRTVCLPVGYCHLARHFSLQKLAWPPVITLNSWKVINQQPLPKERESWAIDAEMKQDITKGGIGGVQINMWTKEAGEAEPESVVLNRMKSQHRRQAENWEW